MRALIYSWIPPWIRHIEQVAVSCGIKIVAVVVPAPNKDRIGRITRAVPGLRIEPADNPAVVAGLIHTYKPDLGVCLGFPWKISAETISSHPHGIVNGHSALLPDGRGPFPIAWAIREGRQEIGFTFHRMSAEYDQGPVLAQGAFPMPADTSLATIRPLMMDLSRMLMPVAFARVKGWDPGEPQLEEEATWAGRFEDDYLEIDWRRTGAEIDRQVRAWQWMGGFAKPRGPLADVGGRRVRVIRVSMTQPTGENGLRMEASDGPIWILEMEQTSKCSTGQPFDSAGFAP